MTLSEAAIAAIVATVKQRMRDYGHTSTAVESARCAAHYALAEHNENVEGAK